MIIFLQPANENSGFLQMQNLYYSNFFTAFWIVCIFRKCVFFLNISDMEAHNILCVFLPPKQMECNLDLLSVMKTPDEIILSHSVAK